MTAHAELPAGTADDHQVLDHQGCDRGALPGPDVTVGPVPDPLAGGGVQRQDVRVGGHEEDLVLGHGHTAVDVPAAQRDVEGHGVLVPPDLGTGPGIQGPDPAVPAGQEHDPVDDDRGGLERVGGRARDDAARPGLEDPCRTDPLDVLGVDLVQRAVALPAVVAVVGEPVLRLRTGFQNAFVGDALHHRWCGFSPGDLAAQPSLIDGLTGVDVLDTGHVLLLSATAQLRLGGYGRGWSGRSRRASGGTSPSTTIAPVRPRPSSLPVGELYQ